MNNRCVAILLILAAVVAISLTGCEVPSTAEPEETPAPVKPVFLGKWGSEGDGDGQFDWPMGIAVAENGNVYVVDAENYRIQYFTADGSFLGKWGSRGTGDGQFEAPAFIAVAPNGTVYVSDAGLGNIQYFTPAGSFLGKWDHGTYNPTGLEFSVANDNVYLVPSGGFDVYHFTSTGSLLGSWSPTRRGTWDSINGLGCGPDGDVYVSISSPGYNYNRVERLTGTGSLVQAFDRGLTPSIPYDIAASPRGEHVYVIAKSGTENKIIRYKTTGAFVTEWGVDIGWGDGEFDDPYGVAVGPGGSIYVADSRNNRVQYFAFKD